MKNIKVLIFIVAVIVLSFALGACSNQTLTAPATYDIDVDNNLSWSEVKGARSYTLEIKGVDNDYFAQESTRRTYFSLKNLEEGDYELRLMSVGSSRDNVDSDWSETIYFHKNYETGCIYNLINNRTAYEIKKVGSASGNVVIEDVYRDLPVVSIAASAFKNATRIEGMVIGNNVTKIGENAFYNCINMKSVTIPDSVTSIGQSAFQSCRELREVRIPESVTAIEDYTFAYCRSLETVEFNDKITRIGDSAFSDCSALTEVSIPDSVISIGDYGFSACDTMTKVSFGEKLVSLGDYAFYRCFSLENVTFSDSGNLKALGEYCFASCCDFDDNNLPVENTGLKSIVLPEGVETLGDYCFYTSASLADVTLPRSLNKIGSYAFNVTKIYSDTIKEDGVMVYVDDWIVAFVSKAKPLITSINETAVMAGSNVLANVKTGTVGIADRVFYGCESLETVTLPLSVRVVGSYAFSGCKVLTRVETAYDDSTGVEVGGLEIIDESAFANCAKLLRTGFYEGLKEIGSYAFYGCTRLAVTELTAAYLVPDTVTHIGTYAFNESGVYNYADDYGIVYANHWVVGYTNIAYPSVVLNEEIIGISDYAFYNCISMESATGMSSARYIGRGAFFGCITLTMATLNTNLREIKEYTFCGCISLSRVTFPSRLVSIGKAAFYQCSWLTELDFFDTNLVSIGDYAFYKDYNLSDIRFSETLTDIGNYAFYNCSVEAENESFGLVTVDLPDSLKNIGYCAFANCKKLANVNFGKGLENIGMHAFKACESLRKINLPDTIKTIGNYAFYKCAGVTEISLGNGVKTIGDYAFYGLEKITRLQVPSSVTSIGKYAFKGCDGLTSLVLGNNVEYIGLHAFYGCKHVTIYSQEGIDESGWNSKWNSSLRPVVYNCKLSDDGTYVVSVTITGDGVANSKAINDISEPQRDGYTFVGWSTNPEATTAEYTMENFLEIPSGTTVYAIWQ